MAELDRDFRRFVLDLFKTITSPKNIVIKKVGGKELTCRELCRHMEASVEKMKGFSGVESYITVNQLTLHHGKVAEAGRHSLRCFTRFATKGADYS